MCDQTERDFKGIWIPKEIYLDSNLSAIEKMIYVELDSLNGEKGCFATNQYIADFCQCSPRTVNRAITHLAELGYITVELTDNTKRVIRTTLAKLARGVRQNGEGGLPKWRHNNTKENNKEIEKDTTNVVSQKKVERVFDNDELQTAYEDWLDYKKDKHRFIYSAQGLNSLTSQINKCVGLYGTDTIIELINISIGNGWKGIIFDNAKKIYYQNHPENKVNYYGGVSPAFKRPYNVADYDYEEPHSL